MHQQMAVSGRASMYNDNVLKLGFFGINCSSGRTMTRVPERWMATWEDNLRFAVMADEAGIDFLLPIARWKGYGGDTDYQGTTFETITWATALLARTKQITVFGTVHAPLFHPLIAAKQIVTADHASGGRFGLNLVCGWNEDEFAMFGVDQREHANRYRHGQEWLDVIKLAWDRDDVDYEGEFFQLHGIREKPKPYGGTRPLIMNAGQSPAGRDFALRNCDAFFTTSGINTFDDSSLDSATNIVRTAKAEAARHGRELDVYATAVIVCRPTRREAEDYLQHYTADADWELVDRIISIMAARGRAKADLDRLRASYVNGHGSVKLIGTPDDVAAGLETVSRAGFRGMAVSFVNYIDEFPLFRDEVLPRLERLGVRKAVASR